MRPPETEIVKRGTIAEIVKAYESALSKIESAYGTLREAEQELKAAFAVGERYDVDFGVLPGHHRSHNDNVNDSIEQVKEVILRTAWRALYNSLEIDRIASISRRDEIHKKIEEGKLPAITTQNVFEMFEALSQNVNQFSNESVLEVYKWLRPYIDGYEITRYKTNKKNATFEIGKKVIKTMMVQPTWGGGAFRTNYYNEKYLIAMDKVFHMLDGKNMLEKSYRSPMVDAINNSDGQSELTTDYFHLKMYGNGNLHIEFIRPDLLTEFNRICGGINLKPSNN